MHVYIVYTPKIEEVVQSINFIGVPTAHVR